ncbi:hypothetical protein [Flavobacterium sp.]|jgi:hypothetical protein|uniref:hypothetical protein n=1 Tax=Flavobacterium sp. TaxID=239 RepID=UPI0037BE3D55
MKQITVRQYTELLPKKQLPYITLFTSLKEKALLKIKINELSYNEVRSIFKKLSTSAEIEDVKDIFVIALKIDELEFYELPLQNFFQIKKYISNYFVNLQKKEVQLLQSVNEDTGVWDMAGGERLNEFADILPLSQLAKIYGGYPFDYGTKKYVEIIYLLRMNNIQGQVENEYQKLKSKK